MFKKFVIGISVGDGRIVVGNDVDFLVSGLVVDRCNWIGELFVNNRVVLVRC